ncbi:MAG: sugar ABC transporter permease [Clostridiales bacterium]|nr:sugar ABC transporter permease [Clostridiales bacterium]
MADKTLAAGQSFTAVLKETIRTNMRQYTMIAALLIIWVIFSSLTNGLFLTPRNLSNLFLQMVTIGIMTSSMVMVMVACHIDLSIGSLCGTLGACVAFMMVNMGLSPFIAIPITFVLGLCVGAWHGYWVAFRGVPGFIVTLASMIAFKGVTLLVTNGKTIGEFPPFFKSIGQGYIPRLFTSEDAAFHDLTLIIFAAALLAFLVSNIRRRNRRISNGFVVLPMSLEITKMAVVSAGIIAVCFILASWRGIPYAMIVLGCTVSIFIVITTKTPFGRHVYATGGNLEAAKLSGINTKKTLFTIFLLQGALVSIAAVVFTARLNAATVSAGTLFELDTIAACIIGGTSTTGGIGTVFGAIIGALVMSSLDNGMSLMNVPIMWQYMVKGAILLFAVWVDLAIRQK